MRNYTNLLNQKKGERNQVKASLETATERLGLLQLRQKGLEEAQAIIQEVARLTQESLKFSISNLVTLALEAVFEENAYGFDVSFENRRNQIECDLWFVRDGERVHPINASGGGSVDVASFALRIALWSLKQNRTRPIFFLDEPAKNLSAVYQDKFSALLEELSNRLNLQFIMITHNEVLTESANQTFRVGIKKGVSYIGNN